MADLTKVKIKDGNNNISPPYNFTVDAANITIGNTNLKNYIDNNFAKRTVYQDYGIVLLENDERALDESQKYSIYMGKLTNNNPFSIGTYNTLIGEDQESYSSYVFSIGRANKIQGSNYSLLIGRNNKIETNSSNSYHNIIIGDTNKLIESTGTTIQNNLLVGSSNNLVGLGNSLIGISNTIDGGQYNDITGRSNTISGHYNNVTGYTNNIFGSYNLVVGQNNNQYNNGSYNFLNGSYIQNYGARGNLLIGTNIITGNGHNNCLVLGNNLQTSNANQIIIGTGLGSSTIFHPDETSIFTIVKNGQVILDATEEGVTTMKTKAKNLTLLNSSGIHINAIKNLNFVNLTGTATLSLEKDEIKEYSLSGDEWQPSVDLTLYQTAIGKSSIYIPILVTLDLKEKTISFTNKYSQAFSSVKFQFSFNWVR